MKWLDEVDQRAWCGGFSGGIWPPPCLHFPAVSLATLHTPPCRDQPWLVMTMGTTNRIAEYSLIHQIPVRHDFIMNFGSDGRWWMSSWPGTPSPVAPQTGAAQNIDKPIKHKKHRMWEPLWIRSLCFVNVNWTFDGWNLGEKYHETQTLTLHQISRGRRIYSIEEPTASILLRLTKHCSCRNIWCSAPKRAIYSTHFIRKSIFKSKILFVNQICFLCFFS